MRDERNEGSAEREIPKVHATKTVRFAALVAAGGAPEVYLPLFDPKQDKAFMRAVKERRVLSIRQEPTSKRTDFGAVGFDERKHTTYLIFPKPLTKFVNARVIGIKYDVVGGSRLSASSGPPQSKTRKTGASPNKAPAKHPASFAERANRAVTKPPPEQTVKPPRQVPQPKTFRVHVRITTVTAKDVTVKAVTKAEAKKKAQSLVPSEGNVRVISVDEL